MSEHAQVGLRVLILDDDPADAELIEHALSAFDPATVVLVAAEREAYTEALAWFAPDAVISDHAVAGFDSLEALRLAQARRPIAPFLVVSGAFRRTAAECLKRGAADFVEKSDLGRLGAALSAAVAQRAPVRRLSARQREVFQLLASGLTTSEIATRLGVSVKTVETHRAEVMKRLGVHELAGLVRYALRIGLLPPAP